ncbi:MAG TPA: NAD-dependent epimerase [Candidatus Macondimonas sp.]|nr:NAD-dependent epimerase [Candidatus Macondimonas sp.]
MAILVTGAAGFIGFHLAERLLARGETVIGLDNLNDYYEVGLKEARLARLQARAGFAFQKIDLADRAGMERLFREQAIERVVHLAAQAGVRYSLTHPHAYAESNLTGFLHVLEGCRSRSVAHLVYASSSSVYGGNTAMPFRAEASADHPLALYGATKKANEAMAHAYSHLYGIPTTGLRFFTVYGPWGRPDMALFSFTRAILAGEPIPVFNHGHHKRDFTYIDDVVEGIVRVLDRPARPDPAFDPARPDPSASSAPYRLYNIGNGQPVDLITYIRTLEAALGRAARLDLQPMQPGDVPDTWADCTPLQRDTGYKPSTPVTEGISRFVAWYRDYYRV